MPRIASVFMATSSLNSVRVMSLSHVRRCAKQASRQKERADPGLESAPMQNDYAPKLFRQRIRTILHVDDLAGLSLAAFKMRLRTAGILRPQAPALPAGIHVVDASVEILGEEAHRIRNADRDPLAVHERIERIRIVARRNGNVLAQTERVVLVDPDVIGRFGARAGRALGHVELRPRHLVELEAFRAEILRIGQSRPAELALAQPAIEACQMAARQNGPEHAIAGDVGAARREAGHGRLRVLERELIILGELCLGIVAYDAAGESRHAAPDAAVRRIGADAVEARNDPLILARIARLAGFGPTDVALAIAVGVQDEGRPALARLVIMGGFPFLHVAPTDSVIIAPGAEPH